MAEKALQTAEHIRAFNRFYLPHFHLLAQKYLNTEYSMAEARILYEIYADGRLRATDIVNRLHIDKGYLSRILKKLGTKSLVARELSPDDSRTALISLTEEGKALAERLILESNRQIEQSLRGLSHQDLDRLSYHFGQIIEILGGGDEGSSI